MSVSGNISFMPKNGPKSLFSIYISKRNDINPNGTLDIIAHGSWKEIEVNTPNGEKRIDARQAAKLIKRKEGFKKAKKIRLFSCSTGKDPQGFAQHLANALGKPVIAPDMTIHCCSNGTYWISDNNKKGTFKTFYPGGIKHGRK